MTPAEAAEVLAIFEQADDYESLMWRVKTLDDGSRDVKLFAQCSDVFAWATADCEQIEAADIQLLTATLADLSPLDERYLLAELFSARKRRMRPQQPCYKNFSTAAAALFDACCTDRERAAFDEADRNFWLSVVRKRKAGTP